MTTARRGLRARFLTLYERPAAPESLSVLRIAYSIVLLLEIADLYLHRALFFDDRPLAGVASVGIILAVWAAVVAMLAVGYRVRVAAVLNYVFSVGVLGFAARRGDFDWHVDTGFLTGALILACTPCGVRFSIDAWKAALRGVPDRAHVSLLHAALPALLVGGMYLDSVFWKLSGSMYPAGLGFWAPASLPPNLFLDLSPLLDFETIVRSSGALVLLFEASFLFLIWWKPARPVLVGAGLLFHLSIAAAFPIPIFSLQMVACYLAIGLYRPLARASSVPPGDPIPVHTRGCGPVGMAGLLGGWALSFAIILVVSPAVSRLVGPSITRAAIRYMETVYPWTGFSSHGVFMDSHFQSYDRQTALVRTNTSGDSRWYPTGEAGLVQAFGGGRAWVYWTFRTVHPRVKASVRDQRLGRFAAFLSPDQSATFTVMTRPVEVSVTAWKRQLLARNLAEKWIQSGRIHHVVDGWSVAWLESDR